MKYPKVLTPYQRTMENIRTGTRNTGEARAPDSWWQHDLGMMGTEEGPSGIMAELLAGGLKNYGQVGGYGDAGIMDSVMAGMDMPGAEVLAKGSTLAAGGLLGLLMNQGGDVGRLAKAMPGMRGGAKGLPMDEASRMQRDRDMGFSDVDVYHGTSGDIQEFSRQQRGGQTGAPSARQAEFFTNDPYLAADYAALGEGRTATRKLYLMNKAEKMAQTAQRNPNISQATKNDFWDKMYEAGEKYENAVLKEGEDFGNLAVEGSNVIPARIQMKNPYLHDFEGKEYREESFYNLIMRAKEAGHDSAIFRNTIDYADSNYKVPSDVYAVFNPKQVRSKFAAFDPEKAHLANLLAGSGAAAIGLPTIYDMMLQGRDQ